MSRVTECPSGKQDKRVRDGLPIGEVAIAKPAKADQIADRRKLTAASILNLSKYAIVTAINNGVVASRNGCLLWLVS